MKIQHLLTILAFLMPCTAFAQEQASPAAEQAAPAAEQAAPAAANPDNAQAPAPRRRITRTIENREFSNKDKILLLLSAHCDFPTKADLIETVNHDMLARELAATQKGGSSHETKTVTQSDVENYLQDTLFAILSDENNLFSVRRRALEALVFFNTPKNVKMLEYIVTHPEQVKRPMMLVQAIRAYPMIDPQHAPAALERYLDSPNDMIRFVTISTLRSTPGKEALRVLKERREIEHNTFFKKRLDEAIANHCKKNEFCSTDVRF